MKNMRKLLASLAIAGTLAFGLLVGKSFSPSNEVGACGWYIYHYGNVVSDSYFNYATGQYSYINFQAQTETDGCGNWYGRVHTWTSDGYALTGGTVNVRSWLGGSYWGNVGTGAGNKSNFYAYSNYMNGSGTGSADDYATLVNGPFGGNYGGYTSA